MRKRLHIGFIALGCITVGMALLFALNSIQRTRQKQAELEKLSDRVERLERSAAAFQKELPETRVRPQTPAMMPASSFIAPAVIPTKPPEEAPPGWQPFVFNGRTYYYAPLHRTPQLSSDGAQPL
jgi:hypothetical protein